MSAPSQPVDRSAPRSWRPLELVARSTDYLRERGVPSPRLDAELLLAHALGVNRLDLYLGFESPVRGAQLACYRELVGARGRDRVPVAYLTGEREFWSRSFRVTRDVLIPRPETELLVRAVRDLAPQRVAEVGVGSGAVVGALALELPEAEFVALDCCEAALAVAAENLERLGVADRVRLRCGDGPEVLEGTYDALVSNPPYIPTGALPQLEPELGHEPRIALDGGSDGLGLIRRLVAAAPARVPGGFLVLEMGAGQAAMTQSLLAEAGAREIRVERDLAGIERVALGRFPGPGPGGS